MLWRGHTTADAASHPASTSWQKVAPAGQQYELVLPDETIQAEADAWLLVNLQLFVVPLPRA